MTVEDIRLDAKTELHNPPACDRLPPVTNSLDGQPTEYAKAIIWCENWIDQQTDITLESDPKEIAKRAVRQWWLANRRSSVQ